MGELTRVVRSSRGISLLAFPPPYKAWFALSSDPDHTTLDAWQEIHAFIWEELALPFADSFFIINRNKQRPNQICLNDDASCIAAHCHDTIHTWGDFLSSGSYRFTRDDAVSALELLKAQEVKPLVWTDHSNFSGNLVHRANTKSAPVLIDASGHEHHNDLYTLDLVRKSGVRYIWDGVLMKGVIGQDRELNRRDWYRESANKFAPRTRELLALADAVSSPFSKFRNGKIFTYSSDSNRQYSPLKFPDGNEFYRFKRFGSWGLGDIDGLSKALTKQTIKKLIANQGTMVFYTHLGKKSAAQANSSQHIPEETKITFRNLAEAYKAKSLNLSSTSKLLDYLVIRDHITLKRDCVCFNADGIRYESLTTNDLRGHQFGIKIGNRPLRVLLGDVEIDDFERRTVEDAEVLSFPA